MEYWQKIHYCSSLCFLILNGLLTKLFYYCWLQVYDFFYCSVIMCVSVCACVLLQWRVRKEAMMGLAQIYKKYALQAEAGKEAAKQISWIKDKLLHIYYQNSIDDRWVVLIIWTPLNIWMTSLLILNSAALCFGSVVKDGWICALLFFAVQKTWTE